MKTFKSFIKESTENTNDSSKFHQWTHSMSHFDNAHLSDSIYGNNLYDHNNHIADKLSSSVKGLSNHQRDGILSYTHYSRDLNMDLIDHHKGKLKYESIGSKELIHPIDSAIKANPLPHDLHVYSRTGFDPRKHVNSDGVMHSPAYISATHNKRKLGQYLNKNHNAEYHIIHFHLKKGDLATHISHLSSYPEEHETLIGRDQKLKLLHTESMPIKPYDEGLDNLKPATIHIHHMEIHK